LLVQEHWVEAERGALVEEGAFRFGVLVQLAWDRREEVGVFHWAGIEVPDLGPGLGLEPGREREKE
jgi:hypothetical protein